MAVNEDLHVWERRSPTGDASTPLVASIDDLLGLLERGGDASAS